MSKWISELTRRLRRDANVSASVNVAKGPGARTSVQQHQRIVQRNGETVVHETRTERKETDRDRET